MRAALVTIGVVLAMTGWRSPVLGQDESSLREDLINHELMKPIEITTSGQPIETPILKYRLLPAEPDLYPGNAVPILLRMTWDETRYFADVVPTLEKWEKKPLDDPEWKDNKSVLLKGFYGEMKRAAYRHDANWEYPLVEGGRSYNLLLPDVQGARDFFRYGLVAKARYHIGRRDFDQARETMLVGLGIFRHFAKTPFFVTQVASSSHARAMLECVDEMAGMPGSPNLYWALSVLPRPMFDLRPSAEFMQGGVDTEVPELLELDRPRTAEQWQGLCDKMLKGIEEFCMLGPLQINKELLLKHARETGSNWGGTPAEGNAEVSDAEAMVRCFMWEHTRLMQRGAALMCLSPREAIPALREFERQKEAEVGKLGIPARAASGMFTQDLGMYALVWSIERKIAALRVVEAIRADLAAHNAKLPEKLSDITDVTLPLDPLTDQPFEWKVSENVGRLSAPTILGVKESENASLEYVLRVR